MLIGNVIYILMEVMQIFPRRYLMLIGRFINGLGSGNIALLRTYASTASTTNDRAKAIAFVTCGQALGLTTGPVFQLLFTPVAYPGPQLFGLLSFNLYTLPAYLASAMNVAGLLMLYFLFNESYAGLVDEEETTVTISNNKDDDKEVTRTIRLPDYDKIAVLVIYATRFIDMFVRTNLETLGASFNMMMFSLVEKQAVANLSITQGVVGALTFGTYLAYIFFKLERL
jgi:MFS family permease